MEVGRGGLIRSKNGCATCRIRRVKCDETRPKCKRCIDTGRRCDGYKRVENTELERGRSGTPPPSRSPALPVLPKFDNPRQKEFFAFFISCTSYTSSLYFGADFWSRRVLQLSLSEPSVRYALCSLSALHRMSAVCTQPYMTSTESKSYALQQYNHAVRCTKDLLAESSDGSRDKIVKGLVACILFVCYENFVGNYKTAQMHLQNGLQIIAKEQLEQASFAIPTDIRQVFQRLDLQAMSFADSVAPYPYRIFDDSPKITPAPNPFISFEGAAVDLFRISKGVFQTAASWEPDPIPSEDLDSAFGALEQWDLELSRCLFLGQSNMSEELRRRVILLRMYRITTGILIATGVYGREILHDDHLSEYERVVAFGEELLNRTTSTSIFSFDTGVITPLFYTATKCRDPRIRRRAIELLGLKGLQEGSWKGLGASKVAKFVMDIEEEGLQPDLEQQHISETSRVHLVKVITDVERCEIRLSCVLRSDVDDVSWYMREGLVSYGDV